MRRIVVVSIIILLFLGLGVSVLAKPATAVATLVVSEGQATVNQHRSQWGFWPRETAVSLNTGDMLSIAQGDVIALQSGASGQLRLYDGSTVDLYDGTVLEVRELVITTTDYRVQLHLLAGKAVNRVVKLLNAQDYFRVSTPSSTAAVRGTLFTVEMLSTTATFVSVAEGAVQVTMGSQVVDVLAGETVMAVVGQPLQVQPQNNAAPADAPHPIPATPSEETNTPLEASPTARPAATQPQTPPTAVTPIVSRSAATPTAPPPLRPTNNQPGATVLPGTTMPSTPTPPATAIPANPTTTRMGHTATPPAPSATLTGQPATATAVIPTHTPIPATATLLPSATPLPAATATPPAATVPPAPTNTATPEPPTPTPELVTLCHIPPGNPNNRQTIQVPPEDVQGHLDHGDYLGPCQ